MTQIKPPSHTPVLIVGGGPCGLLVSILLARQGISSTIFERHASRTGQPKAHAINPRSLEILRQAGLSTTQLRNLGASAADADKVRFVDSVFGVEMGHLPYERQDEEVKDVTPEPLVNVAQPAVEQYLFDAAIETGMVKLYREYQWEECTEEQDGSIVSKILDRRKSSIITVRSKYLLGCDGAHARSRRSLDIPLKTLDEGPPKPIHYCSVNFDADLTSAESGMLWFIMARNVGKRNFIAYDRSKNWVFVTGFDPKTTPNPKEVFTEEHCRSLIDQSIGKKIPYNILSISLWSTTPSIASHYRSLIHRRGFVAGDAAHCFPSTGGLGVNTGFGDVHNLVWKILAVENWAADDRLLDTYQAERIPVAVANSRQSRVNEAKVHLLSRAVLGEGEQTPEERMRDEEAREEIGKPIEENEEHFDSLDLQIGYVYGRSRDPTKSVGHYEPECVPGARLPHAWVMTGDGREVSTLDVVPYTSFTLITSSGFGGTESVEEFAVPVNVVEVGKDIHDEKGDWTRLIGLANGRAAVLVRPDQHVVQRVTSQADIRDAVDAALCLQQ